MNAIEELTIKLAEIMVRDFLGQPEQGEVDAYLHAARQAPQAAADPPEWPAELASSCIYNNCPHPKHCREQNRCTAMEKRHDKPDDAPEIAAKHTDDARTQKMAAELVAVSLDIPLVRAREFLKVNCAWPDGRWYRAARMVAAKSSDIELERAADSGEPSAEDIEAMAIHVRRMWINMPDGPKVKSDDVAQPDWLAVVRYVVERCRTTSPPAVPAEFVDVLERCCNGGIRTKLDWDRLRDLLAILRAAQP